MEKLKDIKIKHNHTLTDILKILIFSLVMLAPFGAVLSKCLYTTFNKNAKDSYSGNYEITYKYQSNNVNSYDDLIVGNIYQFNLNGRNLRDILYNGENLVFNLVTDLIVDERDTFIVDGASDNNFSRFSANTTIEFIYYNDSGYFNIFSSLEDYYNYDKIVSYEYNGDFISNCVIQLLEFNLGGLTDNTIYTYTDYNEIGSVNLTGTLDNSFYYAVNELSDQPLFSWTKDTFIYSTINQMTTGLDFGNNNVLALLLTYWILNTMIYIIFDIIIEVFKKLTHAFN